MGFTDFIDLFRTRSGGSRVIETAVEHEETRPRTEGRLRTLGTFGGVFVPSFLTIIGAIMYLRFSWIVANAGLLQTILIVLIANTITFITALSVSSVASNIHMETGGAYYIISRVLGYRAGGGVGLPLFLSQALSIALYVIGFAESAVAVFPGMEIRTVALITLLILTLVGLVGAAFMIRIQYLILAAILLSLVSIFVAFRPGEPVLAPAYLPGESFWSVFAIFFPAVTGILAGVSMSGDLKQPSRSIPKGVLLSVFAGFAIYLLVPVFLAFVVPRDQLLSSSALQNASRWPFFVMLGVWGATLSSAIGSILAAPRTLQALAEDGIAPRLFRHGVGRTREPIVAMLFSTILALAAVLLGELNTVAELLTMFFLTTYGMLNLAAAFERIVDNPSFQPSLRVSWQLSLLGALGCIAVMFLIHPGITLAAWTAIIVILLLLSRRQLLSTYGDIWEGVWLSLFFFASRMLRRVGRPSGKNWRPLIQVFASDPESHRSIINLAFALTRRSGMLALFSLYEGEAGAPNPVRDEQDDRIHRHLEEIGSPDVFAKSIVTRDFQDGVVVACQSEGFAAGSYNTVMIGLSANTKQDMKNAVMLRQLGAIRKNILIFRKGNVEWDRIDGPIVLWWGGKASNVRFMLVLARLLQQGSVRGGREILVHMIVPSESQIPSADALVRDALADLRMSARHNVLTAEPDRSVEEMISAHSIGAALVILGLAVPEPGSERYYFQRIRDLSDRLVNVLFVRNNLEDLHYE